MRAIAPCDNACIFLYIRLVAVARHLPVIKGYLSYNLPVDVKYLYLSAAEFVKEVGTPVGLW